MREGRGEGQESSKRNEREVYVRSKACATFGTALRWFSSPIGRLNQKIKRLWNAKLAWEDHSDVKREGKVDESIQNKIFVDFGEPKEGREVL